MPDRIIESAADRLITDASWDALHRRCRSLAESKSLPPNLRVRVRKLAEAMDPGDWAKIGVLLGLAWYKLDRLISQLETIGKSTQSIDRNTSAWAGKIDALIQAVKAAK